MKKSIILYIAAVFLIFSITVSAQNSSSKDKVIVKSEQFITPLLKKWISNFKVNNPDIQIELASNSTPIEDIDVYLTGSGNLTDIDEKNQNQTVSSVGRYAILPVANIRNPYLQEIKKKKINSKHLKDLFFEESVLAVSNKSKKEESSNVTVYSGNNSKSGAETFAAHFGFPSEDIKGKKIVGDDIFLIQAIQKDNTGLSFNKISYLFESDTRKLKNDLMILPLDVKRDLSDALASANIDVLLQLLEREKSDLIPVADIKFSYKNDNTEIINFIKWILSDGHEFNHQFGFLNLEPAELASEVKKLDDIYLTSSN